MIRITLKGETVATSQNLRGITRYASKEPVLKVKLVRREDGTGTMFLKFWDKAISRTRFASATVAHNWLLARRSWGKPDITTDNRVTNYNYTLGGE